MTTENITGTGITFKKGGLHESLGVPEGTPIPAGKMRDALAGKYGAKAKRQAQLARTMEGFKRPSPMAKAAAGR